MKKHRAQVEELTEIAPPASWEVVSWRIGGCSGTGLFQERPKNKKTAMDKTKVSIFHSFEEENQAEYRRRARMTPEERMREFAAVQERVWGKDWASRPMVKVASWEILDW